MNRVCAGPVTVKGIDLYHGDPITDVTQLKPQGIEFVFLKAYERSVDPLFDSRWASMGVHGMHRGAYDFFHPGVDPIHQADSFLRAVSLFNKNTTDTMWLDWESTDNVPTPQDRANGLKWLLRVEEKSGKTPGIYVGPYFAEALKLDQTFKRFPLWVCHYGAKCPLVPPPWDNWKVWQYSETGSLNGIKGHVDLNMFNGNSIELAQFLTTMRA
jgi:lysozyme